jgi:hypothetical protein
MSFSFELTLENDLLIFWFVMASKGFTGGEPFLWPTTIVQRINIY